MNNDISRLQEQFKQKNKNKQGDFKSICVALPCTGYFDWRTVATLFGMQPPKGYKFNLNIMANCLVYDAREKLCEYALATGATHILFIDSDMTPPPNTVTSMIKHDKDIISAKIFKRKYPFQPCFYTKSRIDKNMKTILEGPLEPEKWPKSGAVEMEGVGMACTLIKTEILKKMQKPWFFPLPGVGEDLAFCFKARKQGFKIYTDFGIDCGHIADFVVNTDAYAGAINEWLADPSNSGKMIFGEEKDSVDL